MKTWFVHLWEKLRVSFWFVPGVCVVTSLLSAQFLLFLDSRVGPRIEEWLPGLSASSPEGLSSLLSTAATSVLTLAGLAFSGTLVALSLASNQFGPRLLRNFIRSRSNQVTFGVLLGNFAFCLVVMRFLHAESVPQLSVLAAFLLSIGSLAAFVLFVHSIITSMLADRIVADVHHELKTAVEHFFPDALPSNEEERKAEKESESWEEIEEEACLASTRGGYLQAIDIGSLVAGARELDCRVRSLKRPGQFVHTTEELVAYSSSLELEDRDKEKLLSCFLIGDVRTPEQDFEFYIKQLVEVALRALSPGINDPFTAITCIDFLSEALATISRRRLPRRIFSDEQGNQRLAVRPVSFQSLIDTAFLQLRQAGGDRPDIAVRLLDGLRAIAKSVSTEEQRKTVLRHTEMVAEMALKHFHAEYDRECFEERRREIRALCET